MVRKNGLSAAFRLPLTRCQQLARYSLGALLGPTPFQMLMSLKSRRDLGFRSVLLCLLVSWVPLRGLAAEARDGRYYFDALKESMIEVLKERQPLINQNADGSAKSETLLPDKVYAGSYATFKTIAGADFSPASLAGERDPIKIAQMLTSLLQGGRDTVAKLQEAINKEPDGSVKPKKFIPAVFGREVADRFKTKTGAEIKQTTLGKNGHGARNQYNAPDDWEKQALQKVTSPDWPLNQGFGEAQGNVFRYLKPVYIKEACLVCHGDPEGSPAPYNQIKEGYKVGEVRGGLSVRLGLDVPK